jgi:hypothetical protein
METLRISPRYTADDWWTLERDKASDWPKAVKIVRDRLHGRFLHFSDKCLQDDYSGFVVLAIDCLLAETIQQFIEGVEYSKNPGAVFKRFLGRPRFQPHFRSEKVREEFYEDIRCGLLHQAEAKKKWLIRRKQKTLLKTNVDGNGYILDVGLFHGALKGTLKDYFALLCKPESDDLRGKLWTKMNAICNARMNRGAMELVDAAATDPTA